MQFVRHGPDIPERLLQAHEEGRVVFFCGAGISYPARLPGFSGLVKRLYEALGETPNAIQQAAIKAGQFDTAIGLLEAGIVGGREPVRRALAKILTPDLSAPNATATHEALLTLAKNREGRIRLITTNFDRLFEEVIANIALNIERFQAPLLPVPKNRWDGLVYLHGLLSSAPTAGELDRLVVSSGDFGLAYLVERWAARFVSELFRNYTICFVGYSINDPVLRYMMDALAADRLLGESSPEMFAFGSYSKGKERERANEWRAKNVTPILYREYRHHTYLHKTLHAWSAIYRDGVRGKERIVAECAMAKPLASTQQDDFVGRMLWALSDMKGLPAKRFAELDPVPSLDWLDPLCDERYEHADLIRFGVPTKSAENIPLSFSLLRRPAPYDRAPWMTVVSVGSTGSVWDDVMSHLAHWLTRHLDDPKLVLWLAKRGGQLSERFAWLVGRRLEELDKLVRDENHDELARIRAGAPTAIPGPLMRVLWRLFLAGRLKSHIRSLDLYGWLDRFRRDGLTPTLRMELREILTPRVVLREPFRWGEDQDEPAIPKRIRDLVEWEVVLSVDHAKSVLSDLPSIPRWIEALPDLLADFTMLLRDALDLMRELGGIDEQQDRSYVHQPSISDHPQNTGSDDWTVLIDLTRDAWLAAAEIAPERARLAAEGWWQIAYPLFRRLAFFAATQGNVIPIRQGCDWLLADAHWWLWSVETRREAMRLLVAIAPKLDAADLAGLEQAILIGPPRAMFKEDIKPERWAKLVEGEVWLRLAKLEAAGAALGNEAETRMRALTGEYPQLRLAADERDEFPYWTGDGDEWRKFVATPRRRRELAAWLRQHPSTDHWQEDDWRQRCRDNFAATACALRALAQEDFWPSDRWREALQAWSEDKLLKRSWRYMGAVLANASDEFLQAIAHGVAWWLQAIAKSFDAHERIFLMLCQRMLAIDYPVGGDTDDPVSRAINHPVGQVTEALLRWWYRRSLEDGQGLPEEIKPAFTEICETQADKFRQGRVILAAHVIALYRVDRDWATMHLLPFFDWQHSSIEARSVWEGFLWTARLYRPLLEAIKVPFLSTAQRYGSLGDHGKQYAALLTFAALEPSDSFSVSDLTAATHALPAEGLREAAHALVRALEGSGGQHVDYWAHRVKPYLQSIWPKSRHRITPEISEGMARLCIAAKDVFPEAFEVLRYWLQPALHADYIVDRLHEADVCRRFPDAALAFLDIVVSDGAQWPPTRLKSCLEDIRTANPKLAVDARLQRLAEYLRRNG